MREQLSHRHIKGRGIEIGGLHFPTPVLPGVIVDYVDRMPLEKLRQAHSDVKPVPNRIIVDDAETLCHFKDDDLDFVIGNHVLEHCHDFIGTLKAWHRVLRRGGIVYAAIPEKTQTFDAPRAVTTLWHILCDHAEGPEKRDREHYTEWMSVIDKLSGDALTSGVEHAFSVRANIHFHVWDKPAMAELMNCGPVREMFTVVESADNGAEIIWILRKL